MSNKNNLKCWLAGSKYPMDFPFVEAVFANTHREARKVVWHAGRFIHDECDSDFMNLALKRHQEGDKHATGDVAYVVKDDSTLHSLGWGEEGAARCDTCGLAHWDGLCAICEGCNQCDKCGCDCNDAGDL